MRISDWSSDVCSSDLQFAVHHPSAARFKAFYRRSFIPDEAFFQTLMMNSAAHSEVMNDDLRTLDWVQDGETKLRPRTFVTAENGSAHVITPVTHAQIVCRLLIEKKTKKWNIV